MAFEARRKAFGSVLDARMLDSKNCFLVLFSVCTEFDRKSQGFYFWLGFGLRLESDLTRALDSFVRFWFSNEPIFAILVKVLIRKGIGNYICPSTSSNFPWR